MNCPKCGYEQEQRLDCRKCGIVFSKYLAMQSEPAGSAAPAPSLENGLSMEILELRQSMRDLNRKFSEVEFERVERGQLKGEIKALDKRLQAGLDQLALRLEEMEKLLSNPQAPPPPPDAERLAEIQKELLEANVDPLSRRMNQLEEQLERLEKDVLVPKDAATAEMSGRFDSAIELLSGRLDEIEERLRRREKESLEAADSVTAEVLGRLEARLAELESTVAANAAGRSADQSATEYQDMRSQLRALDDGLAAVKMPVDRIPALQQDLAELSSEISKLWSQVQAIENKLGRLPSPAAEPQPMEKLELDIRSIRDSLQEIRDFVARATSKA